MDDITIWTWIAAAAALIGGIMFRENVRQSQACRKIGRVIASKEFLSLNPNGFQDAISDPRHNNPMFVSILILGSNPPPSGGRGFSRYVS